jgi:HPt (histidine-containing phosphotransfer) domain-containing protein
MVNKDEILVEVVDRYLEETPMLLQALSKAVARGEAEVLQRTAHTLKSTSAMLGATSLSRLCQELETIGLTACSANAPAGSLATAVAMVSQVKTEYEAVQTALRQKRPQLSAT